MKGIKPFLTWFQNVWRLVSGKAALWIGIRMVSSLLLAGTEYVIAILIIAFLFTFKLVESSQVPSWLFFDARIMSPTMIWVLLLLVGVVRAGSQLVSRHTGHVVLEFVRARLKIIQGYQMLIMEKEHGIPLSEIGMRMGESFPKATDYVGLSTGLISYLTQTAALGLGMFYLAWRESIVGILYLSVAGLIILQLNRRLARVSAKIPEQRSQFERTLVRICRNWLLIRILHLRNKEYRVYLDSVLAYFNFSKKAFYYRNVAAVLPPFLGILALAVIIFASIEYFKTPSLRLVGFVYLFVRFTQAMVTVTDHISGMNQFHAQFKESVMVLSSMSPDDLSAALRPQKAVGLFRKAKNLDSIGIPGASQSQVSDAIEENMPPDIAVVNISFSWADAKQSVFKDLSFGISAGSQFGIVGPNGSGKSTLLGIILGVLKPSAGYVHIGGAGCQEYVRKSRSIGYVSDDPYLIHGSVRGNVTYGLGKEITDQEIWDVLKMVRLDTATENTSGGLGYMIQENGEGLSSGEKQRLALARAFLRKPVLLVLDEASANLDRTAEAEISEILSQLVGRCTMIIVSHKPGILRGVNHILDLGVPHNSEPG